MQIEVAGLTDTTAGIVLGMLLGKAGVTNATADVYNNTITVEYNDIVVTAQQITDAVAQSGHKAQARPLSSPTLALLDPSGPGHRNGVGAQGNKRRWLQVINTPHETCIVRLKVSGMTCGSCSAAVTNMLLTSEGVTHAAVSHATHSAEVHYTRALLSPSKVKDIIEDCGFDAEVLEDAHAHFVSVHVPDVGLAPDGPAQALSAEVGVVGKPKVDCATDTVTVYYDAASTGPRNILAALHAAGHTPSLSTSADGSMAGLDANARKADELWQVLLVSLLFSVPVFAVAKAEMLSHNYASALRYPLLGFPADELVKWVLTTPLQFVVGWQFHAGALASMRRGGANMDVLVSLSTSASYFYSVISILHHHMYQHHTSGAPPG
jgi:P-type Cu+ transporter